MRTRVRCIFSERAGLNPYLRFIAGFLLRSNAPLRRGLRQIFPCSLGLLHRLRSKAPLRRGLRHDPDRQGEEAALLERNTPL
jgi:hypothetical protein